MDCDWLRVLPFCRVLRMAAARGGADQCAILVLLACFGVRLVAAMTFLNV